ncbi:MAG: Ig-like domain-containing protein [Candidatus Riflebacteria bacterium]|nr:Ig-like domain-containing protein [Candidatus Riflebacteria bacterium]
MIFCTPAESVQSVSQTIVASQTYDATFTFNLGSLSSRLFYTTEASFQASDTVTSFSTLPWNTTFTDWTTSYTTIPLDDWFGAGTPIASTAGAITGTSIQMRQMITSANAQIPNGTMLYSNTTSAGDLYLYTYTSDNQVLQGPTVQFFVTSNTTTHAMAISSQKCHIFWIDATTKLIHTKYWDGGASLSGDFVFALPAAADLSHGIAATAIAIGATNYIVFAYYSGAVSSNNFDVVWFDESTFVVHTYQMAMGAPPFSMLSISQSPRTQKINFSYDAGPAGLAEKSFTADFVPSDLVNTFQNITAFIAVSNDILSYSSQEIAALPNFETSVALKRSNFPRTVDNAILKGIWSIVENINYVSYCSAFPCRKGGVLGLGILLLSSDLQHYKLKFRPLVFPKKTSWHADTKVLHLQGPPMLNTPVSIIATFAELATNTCRATAANAAGGTLPLASGGVIVNSGTQFTLAFDQDMTIASYSSWIGSKIRILTSSDVATGTPAYVSGTARELTFQNTNPLGYGATYKISIASDVIDAIGTQLWAPATFTFTTQQTSSGILASEVAGLAAYSDSARTQQISNGSEINATTTLYFRLSAVDPAFNTIDVATVSYIFDSGFIASFGLTQPIVATTAFLTATTTTVPYTAGTHTLLYQTASPTTSLSFIVHFPTLTGQSPASSASNVPINSLISLTLSEAIATATVTTQTVRLSRGGAAASFSISLNGNAISIDPDDTTQGFLKTETTYLVEIGTGVTDVAGNPFLNTLSSPATFAFTFVTQPTNNPPVTFTALNMYRDAGHATAISSFEAIPATQTVFVRAVAVDAATQTLDISTCTLQLPSGAAFNFSLTEIASDSTGKFDGQFDLSSIPIYNFSGTSPPLPIATLTFTTAGITTKSASVTTTFPQWQPTLSSVRTTTGTVLASNAAQVLLDSAIIVAFDPPIASSSVTATSITLTKIGSGAPTSVTTTMNASGSLVTLTPTTFLDPDAIYEVAATYDAAGLKSLEGNPLYRAFNFRFNTQPGNSPPVTFTALALYRDAGHAVAITPFEAIPATQTIFVRATAVDAATQTRDISTCTLQLPLGATFNFSLTEIASNSGQFDGQFDLSSIPIYNFTGTLASQPIATLTFTTAGTTTKSANITANFPQWQPTLSSVRTTAGVAVASNATQVLLDSAIIVAFDPPIASSSVTATSITLTKIGAGAPTSVTATMNSSGSLVTLAPTSPLDPDATYEVAAAYDPSGLKSLEGNPLYRAFNFRFNTQSGNSPPVSFTALALYRDAGHAVAITPFEAIPATLTIFVRATAVDAATQTRDTSTCTLQLPLGATFNFSLTEIASNSGQFDGQFDLSSIPIYNFTGTLASQPVATLTFTTAGTTTKSASVTANFPQWQPTLSSVRTTTGVAVASNATQVLLDSAIIVAFDPPIASSSVTATSITLTKIGSGAPTSVTSTMNASGSLVTLTPAAPLDPDATYEVAAAYDPSGLKSLEGNPLYRAFNFRFNTQSGNSPPITFTALGLYRDAGHVIAMSSFEAITATQTIFVRALAVDAATQTRDVSTCTLLLPSGASFSFSLTETASDSTGIFDGQFDLSSIPLYNFSGISPPLPVATLTFTTAGTTTKSASVTANFPQWQPALSSVRTTAGTFVASNAAQVLLDSAIIVAFDPPIASSSVTATSITLKKIGSGALTSVTTSINASGSLVTLTPTGPLDPNTTYEVAAAYAPAGLKSPEGNPLYRAFNFRFSTQSASSPPVTFTALTLYRDAGHVVGIAPFEAITATQTVFVRALAVDAATQTRDVSTCTLLLPSGASFNFSLTETASDSTGIFDGQFDLSSIPIYNFSGISPPLPVATLTFTTAGTTSKSASVTANFPQWQPALSSVRTTAGTFVASNATQVLLDSAITVAFNPPIASNSVTATSITLKRVGTATPINVTTTMSTSGSLVTLTPTGPLDPAATYEVAATYDPAGLKSPEGNPLYQAFNFRFSTQPGNSPPVTFTALSLYRDAAHALAIAPLEAIPATQTIFVRATGVDAATQTRDVSTCTLQLPSGAFFTFSLTETASDSTGKFDGQFDLSSIPIYNFSGASPPLPVATLTFTTAGTTTKSASVIANFPQWQPALSSIRTTTGTLVASNAAQVLLDSAITVAFNPPIASNSVTATSITLTKVGAGAPTSVSATTNTAGSLVTLTPTGPLAPDATYEVAAAYDPAGLKSPEGNPLYRAFNFRFNTQSGNSPPVTFTTLSLYRDASHALAIAPFEAIPATQTIFVRATAVDAATQTRDVSTCTLQLPSGVLYTFSLTEIASDSTGKFDGQFDLSSIPIYNFSGTSPPLPVATLTFSTAGTTTKSASVTANFPQWQPASSNVRATTGTVLASNAVQVLLDTAIIVAFNPPIASDSVTATSITLTKVGAGAPTSVSATMNTAGSLVTLTPTGPLAPDVTYEVAATYDPAGLKSPEGNPLYRAFNFRFTTQSGNSPPVTFTTLSLFRDAGHTVAIAPFEAVPATQTIFVHATAVDAATQTRDVSTCTLQLPSGATFSFSLTEIASDSTGKFDGQFDLSSIPIYNFSGISPPLPVATLTFTTAGTTTKSTGVITVFPQWQPALSSVRTTTGTIVASNAAQVLLDSAIIVAFNPPIASGSVTTTSITLTKIGAGTPTIISATIDATGSFVTITPIDPLSPDATYEIAATYDPAGLKNLEGNPLYRAFNFRFNTQPGNTPPTAFTSLSLYGDASMTVALIPNSFISATQNVYIKLNAPDKATQTRDIASMTLTTSWGTSSVVQAFEAASDSGGIFYAHSDLSTLAIYGFPTPLPPSVYASLTWSTPGALPINSGLGLRFPVWDPASSTVNTINGTTAASGAALVALDSTITVAFNPPLDPTSVSTASLVLSASGTPLDVVYNTNPSGTKVTMSPMVTLPPATRCTVSGIYGPAGLRGVEGNPLNRIFTFSFTTQLSQTQPSGISSVSLFSDPAFLPVSRLQTDADIASTTLLAIEAVGSDASPLTVDATAVTLSTGQNAILTETASNSGRFRGIVYVSNLSNHQRLTVQSTQNPDASASVLITFPGLVLTTPASGATNVSIGVQLRLQADEDLDISSISTTTVRLTTSAGIPAKCVVQYISSTDELVISPEQPLLTATRYITSVNGIRDVVGNTMSSPLISEFTTQASTVSPVVIRALRVYSDASHTQILAGNSLASPGVEVFFEIAAVDLSAISADTTPLRLMSSSGASFTLYLVETGVNTGIFRGSAVLFNEENTRLTISSVADPTFFQYLRLPLRPMFLRLDPASGTADLPLDTIFTVITNKGVNAVSMAGNFQLDDTTGRLNPSITAADPTDIRISANLATGSPVTLSCLDGLLDSDGLTFPTFVASYSTRSQTFTAFTLFSDAGFSQSLVTTSVIEPSTRIWAELRGRDLRVNASETANAHIIVGAAITPFQLSETAPGIFRGFFDAPVTRDTTFSIIPDQAQRLSITLTTAGLFSLTSFSPASGAVGVPADTWPTWNFSDSVDPSSVDSTAFSLTDLSNLTLVPGTLSITANACQIHFRPSVHLTLANSYEMRVGNTVRDTHGHNLGMEMRSTFSVQSPPPPPFVIRSLKNFHDSGYASTTLRVSPDSGLYLEIIANDPSPATIEATRVRIDSSDGNIQGVEFPLLEIRPNSGVFRGSFPISGDANGSTITVVSQADPTFSLNIEVLDRPRLNTVSPASGSSDIALDRVFQFDFTRAIDPGTASGGGITAIDALGHTIPLYVQSRTGGSLLTITPVDAWSTGTHHLIQFSSHLTDLEGIGVASTAFSFDTRGEHDAVLELFSGRDPLARQRVASLGEALSTGLTAEVSTNILFERRAETRILSLSTSEPLPAIVPTRNTLRSSSPSRRRSYLGHSGSQLRQNIIGSETAPLSGIGISHATRSSTHILTAVPGSQGHFSATFDSGEAPGTRISAVLEFGPRPGIDFRIASLPQLLAISPTDGMTGVSENVLLNAVFNRPMWEDGARTAVSLIVNGQILSMRLDTISSGGTILAWHPAQRLPYEAFAVIATSTLYDLLGQPLVLPPNGFTTGGLQGISLYEDASFTRPINDEIIRSSPVWVELALPLGSVGGNAKILLTVTTDRDATESKRIVLSRAEPGVERFRGRFDPGVAKIQTDTWVPMIPGERIEITFPGAVPIRRTFYWLAKGNTPPARLTALHLFEDRTFARAIEDDLRQSSLFIEILGEDLNWMFPDTTHVHAVSDTDSQGIDLVLTETASHTGKFRAQLTVTPEASAVSNARLHAKPGNKLQIMSVTNPDLVRSIRWAPENRIDHVIAWPSPARGNRITISFGLTFPGLVELIVYDTAGDQVHFDSMQGLEGENRMIWNLPRNIANGVYFYTLELLSGAVDESGTRKFKGKIAILH